MNTTNDRVRCAFTLIERVTVSGRARRAFTLIELLVVVAIIIALLAILMPSMSRAVDAAHRAVCASNLHQQHMGHLSYASDHFGQLTPGAPGHGSSIPGIWSVWATPSSYPSLVPYDGFYGPGILFRAGIVSDGRIMYCPSNTHPMYQFDDSGALVNGWPSDNAFPGNRNVWVGMSYHYRASYAGPAGAETMRTMRATDPGGQALMADGFARNTGTTALAQIPGVDLGHIGGYTVLVLGGSVTYLDDPDRVVANAVMPLGWAGSSYTGLESIWREEMSVGID